MDSFDKAFLEIKKLVAEFKTNEKYYLSKEYQESQARKDFIDKFFIALGWDVNHDHQHDPYQQEVKVEKTQPNQKRPDYTFFLNPNFKDTKFFAEAKKPCKDLRNADYFFQTIRYGWNANTSIAILTDFEEFHILDCRFKPDINTVLRGNHKQYHYSDYTNKEKFSEIYYLFSREAVADNSLERYASDLPKPSGKAIQKGLFKGGYQTIDEDFLVYIDNVRERLAKAFKKNDENLNSEELTEATQRTIDRLVFIRFLEDKLIEQENYVSEFGGTGNAWADFISTCRKLGVKYNGIVFKKNFIDEQNFKGPELIAFRDICNEICHLNSPYDFNAIPIHILGSIYERFLGKVVHATDKRVTVEEKPEVRKAGGVYYTPKYIVDYIVNNTVGKLIEGKISEQIAEMRFADIACGSGSFLISVFECLLNYYRKYYQKYKAKAIIDGCIEKDGRMVLSIKQKQKILLNNIYGVDIDQQATEVTQLSLSLKMLEDETTATANQMQVLFHEKILPDMSKNIVCGNSLIGTDILTQNLFTGEEERKLNPMDFETVFPQVFKKTKVTEIQHDRYDFGIHETTTIAKEPIIIYDTIDYGGFDAIVGNPPYVTIGGKEDTLFLKQEIEYLLSKYLSNQYKPNLYAFFYEKGLNLLRKNGLISFIVPRTLIDNIYYKTLREHFRKNSFIVKIMKLNYEVFEKATTGGTSICIFKKNMEGNNKVECYNINNEDEFSSKKPIFLSQKDILIGENRSFSFLSPIHQILVNKLFKENKKLDYFCSVNNGVNTGNAANVLLYDSAQNKNYRKILEGKDINRYTTKWKGLWINYDTTLKSKIKLEDLITKQNKIDFALRDSRIFDSEKLIIRQTADRIIATLDTNKYISRHSTHCILNDFEQINLKFLLGILNSKLIGFYYNQFIPEKGKAFAEVKAINVKQIPIKLINFQNKTEKVAHDKIVALVEQMLEAKKQLQITKTDKDKTYYERKCSSLDTAIDAEVYKLYDLSEEEIAIIENKK